MSTLHYTAVLPPFPGALRQLWRIARTAWPRPASRAAVAGAPPAPAPRSAITVDARPVAASMVAMAAPRSLPLRVVRVVDAETAGTPSLGRMRISGRMADVCAELDRLAEREAALQGTALPA